MKFVVDAQLPTRLSRYLAEAGHDVIHSSSLPDGNRTPDLVLAELADLEDRVVVTKDRDFEISHTLGGSPRRLLLVSTGNITNDELLALMRANLELIEQQFAGASYVEVSRIAVIVHH